MSTRSRNLRRRSEFHPIPNIWSEYISQVPKGSGSGYPFKKVSGNGRKWQHNILFWILSTCNVHQKSTLAEKSETTFIRGCVRLLWPPKCHYCSGKRRCKPFLKLMSTSEKFCSLKNIHVQPLKIYLCNIPAHADFAEHAEPRTHYGKVLLLWNDDSKVAKLIILIGHTWHSSETESHVQWIIQTRLCRHYAAADVVSVGLTKVRSSRLRNLLNQGCCSASATVIRCSSGRIRHLWMKSSPSGETERQGPKS